MVTALDMDKFILSCSKGLAETTKSKSQTVQFIHESVRDFLLGKNGINRLRGELDLGRSHESLRECCCIYMKIDISEDLPHDMELPKASTDEAKELRAQISAKFPLLQYSVHNVLYHADIASRHGVPQDLFLQRFAKDPWILLDNVFERYHVRRRKKDHTSDLLYITTQKSLASLTGTLVQSYCKDSNLDPYFSVTLKAVLFDFKVGEDTIRARFLPFRQDEEDYQKAFNSIVKYWATFLASKSTGFLPWAASSGLDTVFRHLFAIDAIDTEIRDRKDAQGRTLLALAAQNGHHATVELLLAHKANPIIPDKEGKTSLSIAVSNGDEALVKLLLANGAARNESDKEGRTPLSKAVSNDDEALVKLLLANGAAPDDPDKEGRTPLSIAVSNGDKVLVELLLTNGAAYDVLDEQGRTPLSVAVSNGDVVLAKLLLASKADPNIADRNGKRPLEIAAKNGHTALARLLLANKANPDGADSDEDGRYKDTPLALAIMNGHEHMVEVLIRNGASPDGAGSDKHESNENTPLELATIHGHEHVVEVLIRNGASPDGAGSDEHERDKNTPLGLAAIRGHEHVVEVLIRNGASLDYRDGKGCTALYHASHAGQKKIVELLLDNGADSNIRGYGFPTPLIKAALRGNKGVFKLLLEHGARHNSLDDSGCTALMDAAGAGLDAVIALVLSYPANSNYPAGFVETNLVGAATRVASFGRMATMELSLAKQHGHIVPKAAPSRSQQQS
ncbi:MAG: hypothetical protein Q9198_005775 [Flavoplaca austrocitrina]